MWFSALIFLGFALVTGYYALEYGDPLLMLAAAGALLTAVVTWRKNWGNGSLLLFLLGAAIWIVAGLWADHQPPREVLSVIMLGFVLLAVIRLVAQPFQAG